tara:strand:+ start:705 stop:920 length:216 start_codon:yes stop_codon:yes gene_type:complete
MKSIKTIVINLKNLLPYILLITIYFFFVNLEARKSNNNNKTTKDERLDSDMEPKVEETQLIISIPVIPFSQ